FSSRRRHTRCLSDWSSDVCSSDLFFADPGESADSARRARNCGNVSPPRPRTPACTKLRRVNPSQSSAPDPVTLNIGEFQINQNRSEERRVGKECRSRRTPRNDKKK